MVLIDVNILIYANRVDSDRHADYRRWLSDTVNGPVPFGLSDVALSGYLRVVTNPRIYDKPTPLVDALLFANALVTSPRCALVRPAAKHWTIFHELCRRTEARANVIPDAWFAALAIESGCEWITADRGFARFPGLRFRHPLDP